MPVIDLHASEFDEGTLAKLELFQDYLQEWLPVFIHSPYRSTINIIDFFAGSGVDSAGNPGSPIRILETISNYAESIARKNIKINLILNEYFDVKCNKLIELVTSYVNSDNKLKKIVDITFYSEDFSKLFGNIHQKISLDSNLIFIDQNGIKQVDQRILKILDSFKRTDFLFFISSSYFLRFDFKDYHPDIKNYIDTSKPATVHRQVAKYFQGKLSENSNTLLFPFTIKKPGGYYGLVFGSQSMLGIEKFLSICWKKNEINGEANFDIDEEYKLRQPSLFGPKKLKKLDKFREDLNEFILNNDAITNKDILIFTLTRGFEPKQASKFLKEMRDDKLLEHFSYPKIGYDQVYNKKEVVVFKKRI